MDLIKKVTVIHVLNAINNEVDDGFGYQHDKWIKEVRNIPGEKVIPLDEIQNLVKVMSTIRVTDEGEQQVLWTCQAMIHDLIDAYQEDNEREWNNDTV